MNSNNNFYIFDLNTKNDSRSKMCIAEYTESLPFVVQRIFFQYDFSLETSRGQHANCNSSFVFICVKGSCVINVDDGKKKESFSLDNPSKGLFIAKKVWKEMTMFSSDCILLVLSDKKYDKNEYIRDYEEFLNISKNVR